MIEVWSIATSVYMRTYPEENPTITQVQSGPPCVLLKDKK